MVKKILLIIILLLIVIIGSGIFVLLKYPVLTSKLSRLIWEQQSFEPYTCDLSESDCLKLEEYQKLGWRIKKIKTEPGYEEFPNEVIGLFKDVSSLTVDFDVVASKKQKTITSRLPEPSLFEEILQEAQNDPAFINLLKTKSFLDAKIIDRVEFPAKKGDEYFEFVATFSAGKGCTIAYHIQFLEYGEILERGEMSPYCPGPL